jgi:hypothetical protein
VARCMDAMVPAVDILFSSSCSSHGRNCIHICVYTCIRITHSPLTLCSMMIRFLFTLL